MTQLVQYVQEIIKELETNMLTKGNLLSGEPISLEVFHLTSIGGGTNTLKARDYKDPQCVVLENHPADSRVKICDDNIFQTLSSRMGTGGGNTPMVMQGINGDTAGTLDSNYFKGCGERQGTEREVVCVENGQLAQAKLSDNVGTLNCMHDQQAVLEKQYDNLVVRRLTPLECSRLQGYPDGWMDIGDWVDSNGKTHRKSDAVKYKAAGNSIALPFWQWLMYRISEQLKKDGTENPQMASLFDGIGGFPLTASKAGIEPVWASEIEEFPIAVTKKHFGGDLYGRT